LALPLEGLRVIDFTQLFAGPGTGMFLADQGAEVIKIEPPDGGRDRVPGPVTHSFLVLNRGKRSIVLDIRTEKGREAVHRLVKQADIMLVAWRPGQAERLGYGYDEMARLNPRLVYASITGWGNGGLLANNAGYDRLMQAYTGMMASRPAPDGVPLETSFYVADEAIPMVLCYGIMLALWTREKTGLGQKVEVSQLEVQIAMQSIHLVSSEHGVDAGSLNRTEWVQSKTYRASDGGYVTFVPLTRAEWASFWACLELEQFSDEFGVSARDLPAEVHEAIAARIAAAPQAEWVRRLSEAGVPSGPVLTRAQFMEAPHPWQTDMLVETEHPEAGRVRMMKLPVRLSATPGRVGAPAPARGADTRSVLSEIGYDLAEIDEMCRHGVVRGPDP
jgi:crotonobetainyl-CoA:carnitine CoA-transferase CaiB-like acyl-CoA transferase